MNKQSKIKRVLQIAAVTFAIAICAAGLPASADDTKKTVAMSYTAKSVLLIEQQTGQVLFEQNPTEALAPASLTKLMDLILICEALDQGVLTIDQTLTCSAYAKTMGGSEIWLKEGEQMTVDELLKALIVASANDAAVVFAEAICASEQAFVEKMNQRAQEMGLVNTHFVNCTGFDEEGHYTCAQDVAAMARELMEHHSDLIVPYSTIWMDSLRSGETELVNTNRLVRFYDGTTGLKTGTTDAAGHCLCATATRGDFDLIAVVMGCKTSDQRFEEAKQLLDYGFGSFMRYQPQPVDDQLLPVPVTRGVQTEVTPLLSQLPQAIIRKDQAELIEMKVQLASEVEAPISQGQELGKVSLILEGETLAEEPICASNEVERLTFSKSFQRLLQGLIKMS